jgi:YD repeat-containing protein
MMAQHAPSLPTHIAYADETHYNIGRYRGLALITLEQEHEIAMSVELQRLLQESSVAEFKWQGLRTAKARFAALKMLEFAVKQAVVGNLRVDVLTWDTEDRRHRVKRRDDVANLHRMYYHLFRNVLCERWPDGSIWRLCPDEQAAMKWDEVEDTLEMVSERIEMRRDLFGQGGLGLRLKQEFSIEQIMPCKSDQEPLIQLADLFAGLAAYSRSSYDCYEQWQRTSDKQMRLFLPEESSVQLSRSDRERCRVLNEFDSLCKSFKLGVSLKMNRGLRTFDPKRPINFWWYEPQHEADKAPVKTT